MPPYYVCTYHAPKKVLPFAFYTYQAFKSREGIVSQGNLTELFYIEHPRVEMNKNMHII